MYDVNAAHSEKERCIREQISMMPGRFSHCLMLPSLTMTDLKVLAETGRVGRDTWFVFVDDARYSCSGSSGKRRLLETVGSEVGRLGLDLGKCSFHLFDLSTLDARWYCGRAGMPFDYSFLDLCGPLQDRTCRWLSQYSDCLLGSVMFTFGVSSQSGRASWRHSVAPDTRGLGEERTCEALRKGVEKWSGCEITSMSVYSDSRERMCLMRGWSRGRKPTDEGLKSVFETRTGSTFSHASSYPEFYRRQLRDEPYSESTKGVVDLGMAEHVGVDELFSAWSKLGRLDMSRDGWRLLKETFPWLPSNPSPEARASVRSMFERCRGLASGRMVCDGLGFREMQVSDLAADTRLLQRARACGLDTRCLERCLSMLEEDAKSALCR